MSSHAHRVGCVTDPALPRPLQRELSETYLHLLILGILWTIIHKMNIEPLQCGDARPLCTSPPSPSHVNWVAGLLPVGDGTFIVSDWDSINPVTFSRFSLWEPISRVEKGGAWVNRGTLTQRASF